MDATATLDGWIGEAQLARWDLYQDECKGTHSLDDLPVYLFAQQELRAGVDALLRLRQVEQDLAIRSWAQVRIGDIMAELGVD